MSALSLGSQCVGSSCARKSLRTFAAGARSFQMSNIQNMSRARRFAPLVEPGQPDVRSWWPSEQRRASGGVGGHASLWQQSSRSVAPLRSCCTPAGASLMRRERRAHADKTTTCTSLLRYAAAVVAPVSVGSHTHTQTHTQLERFPRVTWGFQQMHTI